MRVLSTNTNAAPSAINIFILKRHVRLGPAHDEERRKAGPSRSPTRYMRLLEAQKAEHDPLEGRGRSLPLGVPPVR